ncbi:helix-turn-helix domain-containing protein [Acinetobacter sp. ANC 5054]|uniref:helix-turn-helix domain-containing protein n=1 Tax=Acinetobacter sp. ANC 5054 TaxID=1977877 RepID=UPI000A33454E|nr:helix-turn-helix domain-containing protein [Acinetobacter sp. ANC 5054]OTG83277.1 helix-turn-helix domain-containing protein [Acinetobacter sp. ANC 5054]
MSLDASKWAWEIEMPTKKGGALKPLKKLVLLSLADRAGEDHCAYPSMSRLVDDTAMDRKTVLKIIDELIEDGLIEDTGERKGRTKQVKVYQLVGVKGRERGPKMEPFKDENTDLKGTNNGTVPTKEQFQQFHERVPTIPSKGPNVGTRNLPKNLPEESKNKKDWLCFKKLREEIYLADPDLDFEYLMTASWGDREKRAFEIYNADKNLCDALMNFHFADWLIHAYRTKYSKPAAGLQAKAGDSKQQHLTEKQIAAFAQKLAHHSEFSSKYSEPGDSYEKLAAKIAVKLEDPAQAKKWEKYLKQVGFTGTIAGETA